MYNIQRMRGKNKKKEGGDKYVSADGCAKLCSVSKTMTWETW